MAKTLPLLVVVILSGLVLAALALFSRTAQAQVAGAVVVGAGDITSCSHNRDESTAQLLDGISGTVITMGDNAYPDGTLDQFNNCYGPTWGRHKDRTRPSPGNHDYHVAGAAGYYTYFGAAASPLDTNCTSNCKGYYSYNLGEWHIIALNSEISMSAGSAQEQWLRADLAANPTTCTLAYWHKPRFSSGQHGNNTGSQALWQALYDFGADVVLNGHDHTYERFAPQSPSGQAQPTRGIREFVVGTGGASLYSFPSIQPNSEVRNNTTWGVLKLTLHSTSYDWEFVPIAGQTFTDSGSANCVTLGPTPTPTPIPTATHSPTAGPSPTATPTRTPTDAPTSGPSPTPTPTFTPTSTSVPGALPRVDAVSSGSTAGASLTIPHTTSGANRLLLVGVSINNDDLETVSSVTYNGVPLTQAGSINHQGSGGDDSRVEIWRLVAPATGTHDVVITFSADLRWYAVGGAVTFTGVDQADPLGAFAGSYGDSTSASVTVPSAPDRLALGVVACETCTSVTFAAPAAQQWNVIAGGGNTIGAGGSAEGGGPNTTISAALGKIDHWAMGGVSIKPAAVTPTPLPTPTATPTATDTPTATPTPTDSPTPTNTATSTDTPTATDTATPTNTPTATPTPTDSPTPTDTAPPTATATATDTATATNTPTDTPTPTDSPTPTDTATSTDTPTPTETLTATNTPTDTPTPTPPSGGATIYVSSTSGGSVGGVSFADEDILAYDAASGAWSMIFDGSDVGLGGTDVAAFSVLSDDSILISIDSSTYTIPGFGTIEDRDIVRFIPTSLGPDTAGSFEWYFDGSDVGLTTSGEDIDAIDFAPDGRLLVSTRGSFSVAGASGGDEDLLAFLPTSLGSTTSGSWSLYFDGSDVGLNDTASEDVNGVWVDSATGEIYLSAAGSFAVNGVSGTGADIFICTPGSLGSTTSCAFRLYWAAADFGWGGEVTDGIQVVKP